MEVHTTLPCFQWDRSRLYLAVKMSKYRAKFKITLFEYPMWQRVGSFTNIRAQNNFIFLKTILIITFNWLNELIDWLIIIWRISGCVNKIFVHCIGMSANWSTCCRAANRAVKDELSKRNVWRIDHPVLQGNFIWLPDTAGFDTMMMVGKEVSITKEYIHLLNVWCRTRSAGLRFKNSSTSLIRAAMSWLLEVYEQPKLAFTILAQYI